MAFTSRLLDIRENLRRRFDLEVVAAAAVVVVVRWRSSGLLVFDGRRGRDVLSGDVSSCTSFSSSLVTRIASAFSARCFRSCEPCVANPAPALVAAFEGSHVA